MDDIADGNQKTTASPHRAHFNWGVPVDWLRPLDTSSTSKVPINAFSGKENTMKTIFAGLGFSVAALAFAAPAFAGCDSDACVPADYESTMQGQTIFTEVFGETYGFGGANSGADGEETNTFAGVLKDSQLNVSSAINGTGPCSDCGDFDAMISAEGYESILSESGAMATGQNAASAMVENSTGAGLRFQGTMAYGSTSDGGTND